MCTCTQRLSEYYKAAVHEWGNMRALDIRCACVFMCCVSVCACACNWVCVKEMLYALTPRRPNAFIIGQMVRLSCLVKDVHAARLVVMIPVSKANGFGSMLHKWRLEGTFI